MALPHFNSVRKSKSEKRYHAATNIPSNKTFSASRHDSSEPYSASYPSMSKKRKYLLWTSIFLLIVSIVFLLLVQIAQTSRTTLPSTYFIRIDLRNIFLTPSSLPSDLPFLNSIARSIGLHDYYQVGLWTWCSGYNDENNGKPTFCSKPKTLYWFNPVRILLDELLAGATIQLPADVLDILELIRLASNWMFGLFMAGIILTFLYLLLLPTTLLRKHNLRPRTRSCWVGFGIGIVGGLAAVFSVVASVVATVMFVIMRNVLKSQPELMIEAEVGKRMMAFMWIGSGSVLIAWLLQWRCGCCFRKVRRESKERKARKKGAVREMAEQQEEKNSPSGGSVVGVDGGGDGVLRQRSGSSAV